MEHTRDKEKNFAPKAKLEIRAASGGDDAKLIVEDMVKIYNKAARLKGINLRDEN